MAHLARGAGLALAVVLVLALALEIAFRVGGVVMGGTPEPPPPGAPVALCVGDSHTRGRPDPDNYPAALEQLLVERTGRPWRVINVGVPGMSTAQVRARFAGWLDYYHPTVVLLWAGINNGWSHPERPWQEGWLAWVADRSKLVRLVRVTLFYRGARGFAYDESGIALDDAGAGRYRWRVSFGGQQENIHTDFGDPLPLEQVGALTRADVAAMLGIARARGVPMFAVTYPFWGGVYAAVNDAIRSASAEFGAPTVDAAAAARAVARRAPGERLFDDWVHPMPVVYREVAAEAYALLARQGLVPQPP